MAPIRSGSKGVLSGLSVIGCLLPWPPFANKDPQLVVGGVIDDCECGLLRMATQTVFIAWLDTGGVE